MDDELGHFEHSPRSEITKPYRFEVRWRAVDEDLRRYVNELRIKLGQHEQRKRARRASDLAKFDRVIEVLCCNVVAVRLAGLAPRSFAILRANYASSVSPIYGAHFRQVVMLMEEMGLITQRRGSRHSKRDRFPSTITPSADFLTWLPAIEGWEALRLENGPAIVLNKGEDAERELPELDYEWFARAEKEVATINASIRDMPLGDYPDELAHVAAMHRALSDIVRTPLHRSVWRAFKPDYEQGGRLYGGYWETMPRAERFRLLRIEGAQVVNVDYGQLFLRLAYASMRALPPDGDLYDLTGRDHLRPDWPRLREGRKRLVNAIIASKKILKHWPGDTPSECSAVRRMFPEGTKPIDEDRAIKARHHAIAEEWLGRSRIGELMRRESDLLVAVLLRLIGMGVTALPLHDSVIVAQRHGGTAKLVMEEEALRLIGVLIPVKIDTG
ncbi:hypothetical protein [Tardiphaga robiniae]|uniref:hypothetical protein n=1 Tax=Tardiphaga robiniae TaxID=943830 RepID=UPI0015861F25|nr:hypothetical protein [Tardiphaga robiniae]NUU44385.1 hypothetical protein [Tardiphaga robiniae]